MKSVVMLCTAAPGGMAQVVNSLRASGLFARYGVRLVVTHDRGSVLRRLAMFLRALLQFALLLLSPRTALVHAHVAMRGSFWRKSVFLLLARLFGKPTIVHLHGSEFVRFYEEECGRLGRAVVRRVLEGASAVIVLSGTWRDYIRRVAPAATVAVVPNFVDIGQMRTELQATAVPRSSNVILFLGEIGRRKGIYDLVAALPRVLRSIPDATLIAGGTGEIEEVRRLATELGVADRLQLPGWVKGTEKARLLAQAAVYVLPSYNEGLPVSILEAMAAGLPVISTPVGGIPDAIGDGVEGFLVTPGSTDEIADRIVQLLQDADTRQRMGESASRRLQAEFSVEFAIAAIEKLYVQCGAQRAAAPAQ